MADLLVIEDTLTHQDTGSARSYSFAVGPGRQALRLTFEVDPARVGPYDQAVNLIVHDPEGFRGTPGRGTQPARIAVSGSTAGFLDGPLPPGEWQAEIGVVHVLEGPVCTYRLRVWSEAIDQAEEPTAEKPLPLAVPETGPGWYAGDLHMHTHHSDGQWTMQELWQAIQGRNLDFFVLTDHNTLSGFSQLASLETGRVLPIPGMEVTTRAGHLVAVGVEQLIDWRLAPDRRSIADVIRDVHAAGGIAIIAHPGADGSPICHGCRWDLEDEDSREADAVEVWNSPWLLDEDNERSLRYWERWLEQGYRRPLSGGSDAHGGRPTFETGVPTTWVYADSLSREAILAGIRAGRIVVSSGPKLRLHGQAGEIVGDPGDELPAKGSFRLEARVSESTTPGRLRLIGNGAVLAETEARTEGQAVFTAESPEPGWYRADFRALDDDRMLAMSAPLYVGPARV